MIHDISEYISFANQIRKRTLKYVGVVPDSLLDFSPVKGKFTIGDLMRHIGSAQLMFLRYLEKGEWTFIDHDPSKGKTVNEIEAYLHDCHQKYTEGLLRLGNDLLSKRFPTLNGNELSASNILMSAVEHEIHHRGQLSTYLQLNHIQPPQLFGVRLEDIKRISKN